MELVCLIIILNSFGPWMKVSTLNLNFWRNQIICHGVPIREILWIFYLIINIKLNHVIFGDIAINGAIVY